MAHKAPQMLVLVGLALLVLAMTATEGRATLLPGLLLMTAGGAWDALRDRAVQPARLPIHVQRP